MRGAGVQIKPLRGRRRNGEHSLLMTLIYQIRKRNKTKTHSKEKISLCKITWWNDNGMSNNLTVRSLFSEYHLLSNFLPLISNSSSLFSKPLRVIQNTLASIGITSLSFYSLFAFALSQSFHFHPVINRNSKV